MFDLPAALTSLRPGAAWSLNGEDYSGLQWLDDDQTKPTREECKDEMARLKTEYLNKQYQRDRAKAYPSIQQQLDMLYWDKVNNTTTWEDAINDVKQTYPKP